MIPQDKMVRILADIHTTESIIEGNVMYPDTALMVFNQQQALIFERYGVSKEQFKETYTYYLNNLKQMDALYETVVDTLSLRETKANPDKGSEELSQ
ncbi:DUF4296 domain-containing protein [Pontibacter rugosus]|uniref:DUF4296 domain-containing protein n=1 Tax=Pontibacter rugosus TaxID=1745966 RepID=A0ABW3SJV1_9BACT